MPVNTDPVPRLPPPPDGCALCPLPFPPVPASGKTTDLRATLIFPIQSIDKSQKR